MLINNKCEAALLMEQVGEIDLTFLDPPFNQGKTYQEFDDAQSPDEYWKWLQWVVQLVHRVSVVGATVYLMHREKNLQHLIRILEQEGWTVQNVIIWKKLTSAVPGKYRFGKQYQPIVCATKGPRPRVFNRLRIDPPLPPNYTTPRKNGVLLTDVWDDIRELTSGYLAGKEPLRNATGGRLHNQQAPVALLLRILLASSMPGDTVLDPFAGTGTTAVVAKQLNRNSFEIEADPANARAIQDRLDNSRIVDDLVPLQCYYHATDNLERIWK